jgi:enoyl-CoA hydratase/carnithine racemase
MAEPVLRRQCGGIVQLTLNEPRLRNAISVEMREQLLGFLRDALGDPACRAIVLTGAEGNFCSGGQLQSGGKVPLLPDAERTRRNIGILHEIVRVLSAGAKPTIAAVEGYAYGAGFSLAAACDILIAGQGARFCASFGRIGLMADAGLAWSLPQRVGSARAREIMLTGRVVGADEGAAIGLVNRVMADGQALDAAIEAGEAFTGIAPLAIASMKEVLAHGPGGLEAVLAAEAQVQPRLAGSQDYAEGKAAFKERRAPVFRGV